MFRFCSSSAISGRLPQPLSLRRPDRITAGSHMLANLQFVSCSKRLIFVIIIVHIQVVSVTIFSSEHKYMHMCTCSCGCVVYCVLCVRTRTAPSANPTIIIDQPYKHYYAHWFESQSTYTFKRTSICIGSDSLSSHSFRFMPRRIYHRTRFCIHPSAHIHTRLSIRRTPKESSGIKLYKVTDKLL